jgi:hypothetical protein
MNRLNKRTIPGTTRWWTVTKPPRRISKGRTGWLWRDLQEFAESRPVSDAAQGPGRRKSRSG